MAQFVKYVGPAHRRRITTQNWATEGIQNADTVVWGWEENGFSVPSGQFSDKQMDVLRRDGAFVVVGGDEHAPRGLAFRQTGEQAIGAGAIDMSKMVRMPGEDDPDQTPVVTDDEVSDK